MSADHTQAPISNIKRPFIKQDRETECLNLNQAERASGLGGSLAEGEKVGESVLVLEGTSQS